MPQASRKDQAEKRKTKSETNAKPRRKKKKKYSFFHNMDFPRLLRVLFLCLIAFIIVGQYYLVAKGKFASTYTDLWTNYKGIMVPALLFLGYSLVIFFSGYKLGKKHS